MHSMNQQSGAYLGIDWTLVTGYSQKLFSYWVVEHALKLKREKIEWFDFSD